MDKKTSLNPTWREWAAVAGVLVFAVVIMPLIASLPKMLAFTIAVVIGAGLLVLAARIGRDR